MYHFQYVKEKYPKLSQVCSYGIFSKGLKIEFETAVVNEPSVFEPLKFYCTTKKRTKINLAKVVIIRAGPYLLHCNVIQTYKQVGLLQNQSAPTDTTLHLVCSRHDVLTFYYVKAVLTCQSNQRIYLAYIFDSQSYAHVVFC